MTEGLKILLLEDNHYDANLIELELKKNGLNFIYLVVQTRESFEDALKNFIPDIILSDFTLPAFDGVTAFKIKEQVLPEVPFIIVSGTIGEERSVELIKNGVTDYVLKDKLFVLVPKVNRALKEAEEKREKRITDEELKKQYEKLIKIAFMQSHQVRVPIANILGLCSLFVFDNPSDPVNGEVLAMLKTTAESLDKIIYEIVQKTSEIKSINKIKRKVRSESLLQAQIRLNLYNLNKSTGYR